MRLVPIIEKEDGIWVNPESGVDPRYALRVANGNHIMVIGDEGEPELKATVILQPSDYLPTGGGERADKTFDRLMERLATKIRIALIQLNDGKELYP